MSRFDCDRPGLKLIVAYKVGKGFVGLALGVLLLREQQQGKVQDFAFEMARWLLHQETFTGLATAVAHWIEREVTVKHIEFAIALVLLDALSTWVEGLGLHYRQRWAAWWVVLATGALIPFEIFELIRRLTSFRVAALAVNLAIVAYLSWRVLSAQRPVAGRT